VTKLRWQQRVVVVRQLWTSCMQGRRNEEQETANFHRNIRTSTVAAAQCNARRAVFLNTTNRHSYHCVIIMRLFLHRAALHCTVFPVPASDSRTESQSWNLAEWTVCSWRYNEVTRSWQFRGNAPQFRNGQLHDLKLGKTDYQGAVYAINVSKSFVQKQWFELK